jgi:hypothetical protein
MDLIDSKAGQDDKQEPLQVNPEESQPVSKRPPIIATVGSPNAAAALEKWSENHPFDSLVSINSDYKFRTGFPIIGKKHWEFIDECWTVWTDPRTGDLHCYDIPATGEYNNRQSEDGKRIIQDWLRDEANGGSFQTLGQARTWIGQGEKAKTTPSSLVSILILTKSVSAVCFQNMGTLEEPWYNLHMVRDLRLGKSGSRAGWAHFINQPNNAEETVKIKFRSWGNNESIIMQL